jgi:hypothetical protein
MSQARVVMGLSSFRGSPRDARASDMPGGMLLEAISTMREERGEAWGMP